MYYMHTNKGVKNTLKQTAKQSVYKLSGSQGILTPQIAGGLPDLMTSPY